MMALDMPDDGFAAVFDELHRQQAVLLADLQLMPQDAWPEGQPESVQHVFFWLRVGLRGTKTVLR